MDRSRLLIVNSTLDCCYNTANTSPLSSTSHRLVGPDGQTTDDGGLGAQITCCRSWPSLLLFVLVAAGIAGNTLVCCAVAVERKLRNVTNYFLVSLAVADLLVSLVVMPSCIAHDLIGTTSNI